MIAQLSSLGSDLASDIKSKEDDIRVGFGRRNLTLPSLESNTIDPRCKGLWFKAVLDIRSNGREFMLVIIGCHMPLFTPHYELNASNTARALSHLCNISYTRDIGLTSVGS